jgi:hypothetical protein
MSDDYVRRLEDAVAALWAECSTETVQYLIENSPRLVVFCQQMHETIEHEQAMTRRNVWAE